jgi:O-acetyl-ADP-ribose deacetylase (regulator of RNase III)
MINYIEQDLTTITSGIAAHGVNCLGVMGSGVARSIKFTWPKAYSEYVVECRKHTDRKVLLGMVQVSDVGEVPDTLFVANCFTQETCGNDGAVYASLEALEEALENVVAFAEIKQVPLYIPKIGAGLGGLDWDTQVEPIVQRIASGTDIDINVCILK